MNALPIDAENAIEQIIEKYTSHFLDLDDVSKRNVAKSAFLWVMSKNAYHVAIDYITNEILRYCNLRKAGAYESNIVYKEIEGNDIRLVISEMINPHLHYEQKPLNTDEDGTKQNEDNGLVNEIAQHTREVNKYTDQILKFTQKIQGWHKPPLSVVAPYILSAFIYNSIKLAPSTLNDEINFLVSSYTNPQNRKRDIATKLKQYLDFPKIRDQKSLDSKFRAKDTIIKHKQDALTCFIRFISNQHKFDLTYVSLLFEARTTLISDCLTMKDIESLYPMTFIYNSGDKKLTSEIKVLEKLVCSLYDDFDFCSTTFQDIESCDVLHEELVKIMRIGENSLADFTTRFVQLHKMREFYMKSDYIKETDIIARNKLGEDWWNNELNIVDRMVISKYLSEGDEISDLIPHHNEMMPVMIDNQDPY